MITRKLDLSELLPAQPPSRQFFLSPEKQALLDSYKARFYKQLKGKPDPIAPKGKDGNFTIYARIDNFIRAILRKESPQL